MAAAAAVSASAQAHGTSGNQGVFKPGKLKGQYYKILVLQITEILLIQQSLSYVRENKFGTAEISKIN